MRYSRRQVENRCILLPLLRLTPSMEGVPWENLRKILHGGQRMASVVRTQREEQSATLQTDGRICDSKDLNVT